MPVTEQEVCPERLRPIDTTLTPLEKSRCWGGWRERRTGQGNGRELCKGDQSCASDNRHA